MFCGIVAHTAADVVGDAADMDIAVDAAAVEADVLREIADGLDPASHFTVDRLIARAGFGYEFKVCLLSCTDVVCVYERVTARVIE
jgi:hypothetical protein